MERIYSEQNYRKLLLIPLLVAVFFGYFATQVKPGFEFSGGTMITFPANASAAQVKHDLEQKFDLRELTVRKASGAINGVVVQFKGEKKILDAGERYHHKDYAGVFTALGEQVPNSKNLSELAFQEYTSAKAKFKQSLASFISSNYGVSPKDISLREVGPALGSLFLSQMVNALIIAFILMSMLIFLFFRKVMVSVAVIQAAFFDVLVGYGFIGLMGIPLSLASVAPLLMLIGYSVDTDIMLSDRVLKRREGTPENRVVSAMRTGLTMTGTTLAALTAMFIVAWLGGVDTLSMIALILIAGLLGDLVSTWFTNASIVLWIKRRSKK